MAFAAAASTVTVTTPQTWMFHPTSTALTASGRRRLRLRRAAHRVDRATRPAAAASAPPGAPPDLRRLREADPCPPPPSHVPGPPDGHAQLEDVYHVGHCLRPLHAEISGLRTELHDLRDDLRTLRAELPGRRGPVLHPGRRAVTTASRKVHKAIDTFTGAMGTLCVTAAAVFVALGSLCRIYVTAGLAHPKRAANAIQGSIATNCDILATIFGRIGSFVHSAGTVHGDGGTTHRDDGHIDRSFGTAGLASPKLAVKVAAGLARPKRAIIFVFAIAVLALGPLAGCRLQAHLTLLRPPCHVMSRPPRRYPRLCHCLHR